MRRSLLAIALWSCFTATPEPSPAPAAPAETPSTEVTSDARDHGLVVIERWVGGANPGDRVPTVVALHGRGDDPEHFSWVVDGWTTPARVVLPRAPTAFGDGFTWMPTPRGQDPAAFSRELSEAAARVAALCEEQARRPEATGKPVVLGFSQGAMLAYAVAAHHPDAVRGAIPIAGFLPPDLRKPAGSVAPIIALHGRDDKVVLYADAEQTVAALRSAGAEVTLEGFPGVEHTIARSIRARAHQTATRLEPPPAPPLEPDKSTAVADPGP